MDRLKQMTLAFVRDEAGQDLIEYALIAALIALVAIAGISRLGQQMAGGYQQIGSDL